MKNELSVMNSLNKKTIEDIDVSGKRVLGAATLTFRSGRRDSAASASWLLYNHPSPDLTIRQRSSPSGQTEGEYKGRILSGSGRCQTERKLSVSQSNSTGQGPDRHPKGTVLRVHPGDRHAGKCPLQKRRNQKRKSFSELAVTADIYVNDATVPHTAHAPPPALLPSCQLSVI